MKKTMIIQDIDNLYIPRHEFSSFTYELLTGLTVDWKAKWCGDDLIISIEHQTDNNSDEGTKLFEIIKSKFPDYTYIHTS
ncbi:MAG: hypothetical protein KAK00_03095 [Nanoarchaeota archaeon]|nr:hypothetical protein [Nanoarchaeota archaeon]